MRVVTCADDLQWIIQRRDGERSGRARWTGLHYCRSRKALIRLSRASGAPYGAILELLSLPEHFGANG